MPRIPTAQSRESISTGELAPRVSPAAFGNSGLSLLARGMSDVSSVTGAIAGELNRREQQKAESDATFAAQEAEKEWIEFRVENQHREDYAELANQKAAELGEKYSADLSDRAKKSFVKGWGRTVASEYEGLLVQSKRNELSVQKAQFDTRILNLDSMFQAEKSLGDVDPAKKLMSRYSQLSSDIDATYGEASPQLKLAMQSELDLTVANILVNELPEEAIDFIDQSSIPPDVKARLRTKAESVGDSLDVDAQHTAEKVVVDASQAWVEGDFSQPVPDPGVYLIAARGNQAAADKARLEAVDQYNRLKGAHDWLTVEADGLTPGAKAAALEAQREVWTSDSRYGRNGSAQMYDATLKKIAKEQQFLEREGAAMWVAEYGDAATKAKLAAAGDDNEARIEVLLSRQLPDPDNPEKSLNLTSNDTSVLGVREATDWVTRFRGLSGQEAVDMAEALVNEYPDHKHLSMVVKDLMTLPPEGQRLPGRFLPLFNDLNNPWAVSFLNAQRSEKSLSEDTFKQVHQMVLADPEFAQWGNTFVGANLERTDEVYEAAAAMANYAMAMTPMGGNSDTYVKEAIDRMINWNGTFVHLRGQPMYISKNGRSNEENEEIANLANTMFDFLNPNWVKEEQFPDIVARATELRSPELVQTLIKETIQQQGFFEMSPDGNSVKLMMDRQGSRGELLDRHNNPFVIHFDDLDALRTWFRQDEVPVVRTPGAFGGAMGQQYRSEIRLNKERVVPDKTNWPVL